MSTQSGSSNTAPSKALRTKAHILQCAQQLFNKKGFDATTMRDIAAQAELALGATYYHFGTKEELAQALYEESLTQFENSSREIIKAYSGFEDRIDRIVSCKFESLAPYRNFLIALTRPDCNGNAPLSPYHAGSESIRKRVLGIFGEVLRGCDKEVPGTLKQVLPTLFWIYLRALIIYWINDSSPDQVRSQRLQAQSLKLILHFMKVMKLPLLAVFLKPALELAKEFGIPAK